MLAINGKITPFTVQSFIKEIFEYSKKPYYMPFLGEHNLTTVSSFENYELLLTMKRFTGKFIEEKEVINSTDGSAPLELPFNKFIEKKIGETIVCKMGYYGWEPYFEDLNLLLEYYLFFEYDKNYQEKYALSFIDEKLNKIINEFNITENNFREVIYNNLSDILHILERDTDEGQPTSYSFPFSSFNRILFEEIEQKQKFSIPLELFGSINDLITDSLLGGVWSELINEIWEKQLISFDYVLDFEGDFQNKKWQSVFEPEDFDLIVVSQFYEDGFIHKRKLASLKPPFRRMNTAEEVLQEEKVTPAEKVIESIKSLPIEKQQEDIRKILPVIENKLDNSREPNKDLEIIQYELINLGEKVSDSIEKQATLALQNHALLKNYFFPQKPTFFELLDEKHKKAIMQCKMNIASADLLNDERQLVTDYCIIRDMGDIVNDLLNEVFHFVDTTTSNKMFNRVEITKLKNLIMDGKIKQSKNISQSDKELYQTYCDRWGYPYGNSKHGKTIKLYNSDIVDFIYSSYNVIGNILKYTKSKDK